MLLFDLKNNDEFNEKRNLPLVITLIKNVKSFKDFLFLSGITDTSLRLACASATHCFFKKGQYVFNAEEASTCFYGIIRGSVDAELYYDIEINNPNKHGDFDEKITKTCKKIIHLKEGSMFGELGVIYQKNRSGAIVATSDTDLFRIDKTAFDTYFRKSYFYNERIRKTFIKIIFPEICKIYPENKQEETVRKIRTKVNNNIYIPFLIY
jgi:CRP-like cAMP-binding protein